MSSIVEFHVCNLLKICIMYNNYLQNKYYSRLLCPTSSRRESI